MSTAITRTPPHSVEAEEYLISCCFLDGAETVSKCITAEVMPTAFFVPANRVIFEKLIELYNKGTPIDLQILAEELKKSKKLTDVGGYGYLMQLSERMPTTAQSAYFIDKVRELYQLRELIKAATGAVERCYTYGGPEDFEKIVAPLRTVGDGKTPLGERMRSSMLAMERPPAEPQARWMIDHKPICTPGNLTAIVAQAKTGKTAFIGAIIAAAMVAESERQGVEIEGIDTLGVEACAPTITLKDGTEQGRVLIHIDTEQSPFDHYQTVRRAVARAKLTAAPAWLWSFSLAGWGAGDLRKALAEALKRAKRMNVGVFGVILDGVADLCADVNDAEESNSLIAELHGYAIAADAPIICVVHRNEGEKADSAARGHLGKQLARKAETNLRMEKTDGKTVVFSERNRGAPILEKDGPCFEWDDMKGYHVSTGSTAKAKAETERVELHESAKRIFMGKPDLRWSEVNQFLIESGKSKGGAGRAISRMADLRIIVKTRQATENFERLTLNPHFNP